MRLGFVLWSLCREKRDPAAVRGLVAADAMRRKGHDIVLFHTAEKITDTEIGVDLPHFTISGINSAALVESARKIIIRQKLDAVVVFLEKDELSWFPHILKGLGIPLIVSEQYSREVIEKTFWNGEDYFTCLDTVDFIHKPAILDAGNYPEALRERITVFPNILPSQSFLPGKGQPDMDEKRIVAFGPFIEPRTQVMHLVHAFLMVAERHPAWNLHLYGDFEGKVHGNDFFRNNKPCDRISISSEIPDDAYCNAHLFCLPSLYEIIAPDMLMEAMKHALPILGYGSCCGVREVVKNGRNGIMMNGPMSPENLAGGLHLFMQSEYLLNILGRGDAAKDEDPVSSWEQLFENAIQKRGRTCMDMPAKVDNAALHEADAKGKALQTFTGGHLNWPGVVRPLHFPLNKIQRKVLKVCDPILKRKLHPSCYQWMMNDPEDFFGKIDSPTPNVLRRILALPVFKFFG